jgi:SAM-dependent methyltransferase
MDTDAFGGWDSSAEAWIRELGQEGDYGRRFVLDAPMVERIRGRGFAAALDVGCGEGRFCRLMQLEGIRTLGIDPVEALIHRARKLDPTGDYRISRAETFHVEEGSFDLVVSYLTLIDIPDLDAGLRVMIRALRPGGTLLIANLTSFCTAGMPDGWKEDGDGEPRFSIDHYLEERAVWLNWHGIRVQNWHRPLGAYMGRLLENGLELLHFSEPAPRGGDARDAERYRRVPYFHIMEWRKAAG